MSASDGNLTQIKHALEGCPNRRLGCGHLPSAQTFPTFDGWTSDESGRTTGAPSVLEALSSVIRFRGWTYGNRLIPPKPGVDALVRSTIDCATDCSVDSS